MLKAIVFDCYDVLYVPSAPEYFMDLKQRFPSYASEIQDLGMQADYGFISQADLAEGIAALTGLEPARIRAGLDGGHARNQALLDYIASLRPRFRTAMLSNISTDSLHTLFTAAELKALFDEVIISSQVGLLKPSPGIFLLAAQRLGYDTSECLFIDDQPRNCDGARAVGMNAYEYRSAAETITYIKKCTEVVA